MRIPRALLSVFLLVCTVSAQPPQSPRLCAEWEPSLGTLIRWPLGIPMVLVEELAMHDTLYVLVENPSQQSQALSTFQAWGVNTGHCRFITADTWSHWTRDWGPHWVFDGSGEMGIIDPVFDGYPWVPGGPYREYTDSRGYEEDDQVNAVLAQEFSCPLYQFPGYLTGGNFMSDGHGTGFSTRAMLNENEVFWSHEQFLELSYDWLGLESYFITVNPEDYGIQHVDCVAKLLDEETILLKQVDPSHPEYARIETINDQLTTAMNCYGREYDIVRIQCGSYSGSEVAAYTNSYILNTRVFVPLFGISTDAAAISTYQQAMPGYEVIGVPYSDWYYYDALHCRTREVMDPGMLLVRHKRFDPSVEFSESFQVLAEIKAYSGEELVPGETGISWRVNGGAWSTGELIAFSGDSLAGSIPGQSPGSVVDYYIFAADSSGRAETLPRTAPLGYYSFQVVPQASCGGSVIPVGQVVSVSPNPAGSAAVVIAPVETEVVLYSLYGRELFRHWNEAGEFILDTSALPPGCYLLRAEGSGHESVCRLVVVR